MHKTNEESVLTDTDDKESNIRLRVAAIIDTWIVSGPGRQLAALSVGLRQIGIDLRIIMFQRRGRAPSPFISYLDRLAVPYDVLPDRGPLDIAMLNRLNTVLQKYQPDIVQTHGYRPTALITALRLLRRRGWVWIGFFHGATQQDVKDRLYNRLHDFLLPLSDRLVVLCIEHVHRFRHIGSRVRMIPNASMMLPSEHQATDISALRKSDDVIVGVVGRLSYEKGVDLLIEAAAEIRRSGVRAALVIAGEGPEEPSLRRQVQKLGLDEHVHFLGRVVDVMGLYGQLDVVVLPSRSEGLPNVLLEAMQADVPVVATEVGAVPEVLLDRTAGITVKPGSARELVQGIKKALASCRTQEGSAARRAVAERFSLENRVATHVQMYEELLRSARPRGAYTVD